MSFDILDLRYTVKRSGNCISQRLLKEPYPLHSNLPAHHVGMKHRRRRRRRSPRSLPGDKPHHLSLLSCLYCLCLAGLQEHDALTSSFGESSLTPGDRRMLGEEKKLSGQTLMRPPPNLLLLFITTYYKAVREGGGECWRTSAMRYDEPYRLFSSALLRHGAPRATLGPTAPPLGAA